MIQIEIECNSLAPLQDPLRQAFEGLVRQLSDIEHSIQALRVQARKALLDGLSDLYDEIMAQIQPLVDLYNSLVAGIQALWAIIAPYPLGVDDHPYPTIKSAMDTFANKAKAIVSEYSTFLLQKFLELIAGLIPISFLVPVPYFGTIDIVQFFNDPLYRASLKQQILNNFEAFLSLIPKPIRDMFSGKNGGIKSVEMQLQQAWQWLVQKINEGAITLLHDALGALIDEFKEIWDSLGLPDLVSLLTLDVEELIQSAIDMVVAQYEGLIASLRAAYEQVLALYQKGKATVEQLKSSKQSLSDMVNEMWAAVINAILDIEIFGVKVGDMVTFAQDMSVMSSEQIINTLIQQAKDWAIKYPLKLIMEWMEVVSKFFEEIGLGSILEYLSFTFCNFLDMIGLPVVEPTSP